jgi:hypothetical protein
VNRRHGKAESPEGVDRVIDRIKNMSNEELEEAMRPPEPVVYQLEPSQIDPDGGYWLRQLDFSTAEFYPQFVSLPESLCEKLGWEDGCWLSLIDEGDTIVIRREHGDGTP